ncbi:hypothetical protein [Roseobacter sp. HKCCA2468]|uniref:hypothetical protein n=1 Tax=Roseobacter sp. HKCCA2468 TaxID=3120342 RepID=UPI0030EC606D
MASLQALGFTQVSTDNLAGIRLVLARADYHSTTTIDTGTFETLNQRSELQTVVADVVEALAKITAYADDSEANPAPTTDTYLFAGITGVTADTLYAVNKAIDDAERVAATTVQAVQALVDTGIAEHEAAVDKILAYNNVLVSGAETIAGSDAPLTDIDAALVYEQQTLDLSGLTFTEGEQFTLRMGAHSLQSTALGASPSAADLLAALQASPDYSAAEFTLSLSGTALQLDWKEWGEITGTAELRSARPAIEDYTLAGTQAREANGLNDELLYTLNSQIETGTFTAVTDAASLAAALDDIEAAAEAGITAQQAALTKIDTFAKDTTGQAAIPVIEDYRIAGVLGVHSGNIRAVNAQAALAEAASAGSADSLDDIAMLVAAADAAIARIDLYSRSGGTADLGSGQTVLTKADYDAVGLDYITEDNVVAVNLRLTEASEGLADTVNELELIADKAIARQSAALQLLKDYSDASSATVPSLETFDDAAITGITGSNLAFINDRIGSLADDADVLVNTYVSNAQNYPSITSLSDGGWVVTWSSYTQDGSYWGIYQQRFDYTGAPVGDELRVNTYTSNHQIYPDVISLADGGWVVSWDSYTQDGSVYGVYMQRFDAAGDQVGSEARVNTTTSNQQYYSTIGALSDGGWVVSWQGQGSGDNNGVFQQRYDADGNLVGGETRVNATTASSQQDPSIVGLADGGWVVAWMDNNGTDGNDWGIYQKRYDALGLEVVAGVDGSGDPVTGEVVVNTEWNGAQMYPSVTALSNGGWVVTWQDGNDLDGSGYSIALRVYSEDGLPLGDQVLVNQYGTSTQEYVEIAALEDGSFVAVWESYGQDGSGDGVYQRRFAADGTPLDDEMRIATVSNAEQARPVVTGLPDGDWVVSWASSGNTADDNSSYGVFQKRFSGLTGQEVKADLDLSSEVQAIVDASTDAYAKILAFVDGDGSTTDLGDGTTTLTTLDYGNAGIDGIREPYLTRLNGWLNEQSATDFDSHTALQEGLLLQQAVYRIGDYINDVDHVAAPTLLELQALGIAEADVDNLKFIQNYLGYIDHLGGNEITYSDVTGYVADALQLVDKLQQLQGTGSHQYQLSAEEYRALGLGDALYDDASNLYLINADFADASQAEVQNWENASAAINASISAMNAVLNRADGYAGTGGIKDTEANQIEYTYGNVGSSPSHSTYPATKAWDGDTTTFWAGSNDDGTSNNINWIGRYANDAPLHVLESFSWVDRDNFGTRVPGYFAIQGWNGSSWTTIQTYSNSGTSDQSFNVSSSNQNAAYRGFRIYVYYAQDGGDYVDLGEMNFYSRPGFLDLSVSQWNDLGFDFVNSSNYGLVNSALNSANLRYIDHQDLYTQMVDVARDAIVSDINAISSAAEFNFDWRAINFLAGATIVDIENDPIEPADFHELIEAFANHVSEFVPDLATYHLAGYTSLTLAEKEFVNQYLLNRDYSTASPVSDLATDVQAAQDLYAKFDAYLLSNGVEDEPTLADYQALSLDDRVSKFNLNAINSVLRGETESFQSFNDLVSVVDNAVAIYEALLDDIRVFNEFGVNTASTFRFVPDTNDGVNDTSDRAGLTVNSDYSPSSYWDWELFDRDHSTLYATAGGTLNHILGWWDSADLYPSGALQRVYWDNRDDSTYKGRVPGDFRIEGWNGTAWEVIQTEAGYSSTGNPTFYISNNAANRYKSYSGFQLVVTDTWGGDHNVNLWELVFYANPVLSLTAQEWNILGVPGVNSDNIEALNNFARDSGLCDLGDNLSLAISQIEPLFAISDAIRSNASAMTDAKMRIINKRLFDFTSMVEAGTDNYLPPDLFGGEVASLAELQTLLNTADASTVDDLVGYLVALDAFDTFITGGEASYVPVIGAGDAGLVFSSERTSDRDYDAWHAFDGSSSTQWSTRDADPVAGTTIGWKDESQLPGYLTKVIITSRADTTYLTQSVKNFDVQGWDAATQTWVTIQTFNSAKPTSSNQVMTFTVSEANQSTPYNGFRLYVNSNHGAASVSLNDIDFVVSHDPHPMSQADLAALGFDVQNEAEALAVSERLLNYSLKSSAPSLLESLYDAKVAASDWLLHLIGMQDTSEYFAQSETIITAEDLNDLLGDDYFVDGDTAAIDEAITRLIGESEAPVSQYDLEQLLTSDAYIHSIAVGPDGSEIPYDGTASQDNSPDLTINLVEVSETDQLFLIVDGTEIDLGSPTQDQLTSGEMVLDNFDISPYDASNDGLVSLEVKVLHSDGNTIISDDFTYLYSS